MKQLRRNQEFDRRVIFLDDQGDEAPTEGAPVWASSDSAAVNVISPPTNPASGHVGDPDWVTIQALGAVGASAVVSVTGDADLGEGVVPVVGTDDIQIVSGSATSASFTDEPERPIPSP
jgi:hypothetical protein